MVPDTEFALEPPPGVIPNYDDPPTTAGPLVAGLAIMIAVSTLAFAARLFTKVWVMKQVQVDDYTLILGWAFFIVYQGFIIAQTPYSTGRHQWDVTLTQMADFRRFLNYSEILYCCCMIFTKFAILLQLKRIFRGTTRDSVYWLSISLIVISTLYYLTGITIEIVQCIPREKIWNTSIAGHCVNNNTNIIVSGAFNLGLDIVMFMLPIYAILRIKIPVKRKLGICAIFATGMLACVSSLLRLYYSVRLVQTADLTYEDAYLLWSASLEGASAILVASFPVMPRLYQFLRGEKTKTSVNRRSGSHLATFGSAPNSKRRSMGPGLFSKYSHKTSGQTTQLNSDEPKLKGTDWMPLKDAQEYGLASAKVTLSETREDTSMDLPDRDIRKTIRIETRMELRSVFED